MGCKTVVTYLVGVVQVEQPVLAFINVLVARVGAANHKRSIHVHVVAGEIESNQALEKNGPSREGRGQEDEEARRGAAIRHHVENGAETRRLFKNSGGVAINGIEEARDAVQDGAGSRVDGHVV